MYKNQVIVVTGGLVYDGDDDKEAYKWFCHYRALKQDVEWTRSGVPYLNYDRLYDEEH